MTLQEAIDNDFLVDNGPSPTKSYTSQVLTGHSENIFVSVSGNEKTIGQAISSSLCGSGSDTYNSAITLGHDASDIWVSIDGVEMTLQSAINGGEFCCAAGTSIGACRQCDGSGGEQTPVDDAACGTIDCDGLNYYFTSGSASPTGTNYCMLRDYADITSSRCEGLGDCKDANTGDCASYSDSTATTCGTCKYASGACSSCTNYPSGTSCGTKQECNGAGSCVTFYTWSNSAQWAQNSCWTESQCVGGVGSRCYSLGGLCYYYSGGSYDCGGEGGACCVQQNLICQ